MDVIGFLSDFVSDGLEAAVERKTENFYDLVFGRKDTDFRLSVNANPADEDFAIRYDVVFGMDLVADRYVAEVQSVRIMPGGSASNPEFRGIKPHLSNINSPVRYSILADGYQSEPLPAFKWLRGLLRDEIRTVTLDARALADPSPAGSADEKRVTGAGLARLIASLKSKHQARFQDWLLHVQTALPEIRDIDSITRAEDNKRYVMVLYKDQVQVPSWMLSEGTLRLLQLTILAYLPDFHGVYLIEEPENGVHPSALETIYQSLSSIYSAQVLVSSHSPILLNMAKPEQLLCFSKSPDGVKIVRGNEHPALKDWRNEVSLGTLAASGILG